MSTDTINYTGVLDVIECGECGIHFAMPRSLRIEAQANHSIQFWCPKGCRIAYRGPTTATRLRAELDQVKADRDHYVNEAQRQRQRVLSAKRSNAALRGHLTRWRRRVANGVCPVAGCHRHFPNVQAHVATQHGEWLAEHPEVFEEADA